MRTTTAILTAARFGGAACLALALLFMGRPAAAGDAFALVSRAMQAKAAQTYCGQQTITWSLPPGQGGMMQIVTALAHRGACSRLTYLFPPDAAGRVMTDDGAQTVLYQPGKGYLLVGPSVSRDAKTDRQAMLALLHRNYTCTVVRREHIGARSCAVVAIRPRAGDGPYKVCWIDQAHPFVLRLEEYDGAGCRRYVSSYDTLTYGPHVTDTTLHLPGTVLALPRRVVRETPVSLPTAAAAKSGPAAGFAEHFPAWMPPGYALLRVSRLVPGAGGPPVVQMRCSDGLQTLTITESKMTGTESKATGTALSPAMLNGALARYGQQAWLASGEGLQILVRGDLSLSAEVGADMARALAAGTERRLARAFRQRFGCGWAAQAASLRPAGWDYVSLASAALFSQQHISQKARIGVLLGKRQTWRAVAHAVHADVHALSEQARAWIASALS